MKKFFWVLKIFFGRAKKVLITTGVFITAAALCLNILLILVLDYQQNFDREHLATNGADNSLILASADPETLREKAASVLEKTGKVRDFEFLDVSYFWGGCTYGEGTLLSYILPAEKEKALSAEIGEYRIILSDPEETGGVYLPYSFYASGNYSLGDNFSLTDNSKTVTVPVSGFYSSTMTSSQNCYMIVLLFGKNSYQKVTETFCDRAALLSVKLLDPADSEKFESLFSARLREEAPEAWVVEQNRVATVRSARYVTALLITALIGVAALALLLISFITLGVDLHNFVRDNAGLFGILKALGYNDRSLLLPIGAAFVAVALFGSILGTGASYAVFPFLNRILEGQIGIVYSLRFLPGIFAAVLGVILFNMLVTLLFSSKHVTGVSPVDAIRKRKNISQRHFGRFSVAKSPFSLNFSIGLKNVFARPYRSVMIFLTLAAVSFGMVASLTLFNFAVVSPQRIAGTVFGESADASATVLADREAELEEHLRKDGRVADFYSYNLINVDHVGGGRLYASVVGDTGKLKNTDLYEGRMPRTDTEMVIGGKYAEEHHIRMGDAVRLSAEGREAEFTVCGFTQTLRTLGNECLVTREGYERMQPIGVPQVYILLNHTEDHGSFAEDLRKEPFVLGASDLFAYRVGTMEPYVALLSGVAVFLMVCGLVTVFLVIGYLTSYLLSTKKKSRTLMRAIGFHQKDCTVQLATEIVFPVVVAVLVGTVASSFAINPLFRLFLHGVGLMRADFGIPPWQIALAAFLLVAAVGAFVTIPSAKEKKLSFRKFSEGM